MMKLTKDDVLKVAKLAKLEVTDQESETFVGQLSEILAYVEQLQQWETAGLELTATVMAQGEGMRDDRVQPCLPVEKALANAPEQDEGYFLVPKIIEER